MKKFLLFIGYVLSVVIIYLLMDFSLGKIFDKCFYVRNDQVLEYALRGGGGEDLAVLGASRAAHHYVPSIIEDGSGLSVFNYGMDGRNIYNHYVVAELLFADSTKRPSIIVLEIASIDINDSPGHNGEKLSNLYVLYNNNKAVRELIDTVTPEKRFALKFFNLYRYNSSLLGYLRVAISKEKNDFGNKGYKPLTSEWKKEPESRLNKKSKFDPTKEVYLRRLIEDCLNYNVKLFVFNSPEYYNIEDPRPWENKIKDICDGYDVPFFNHAYDSLFLSHREWFNEPFHLNDIGAKIYSKIVVQDINPHISSKKKDKL